MASGDDVLYDLVGRVSKTNISDALSRKELLANAQKLVNVLQDPAEKAFETIFSFAILPCLCIAADLGLFPVLATGPKNARELADSCEAEYILIVRIMRILASFAICTEVGPETYSPTPVWHILAVPALTAGIKHNFDLGYRPSAKLPEYLRETNYRSPDRTSDGPFQYAMHTKLSLFQWLETHQRELNNFNSLMTAFRAAKEPWVDLFPAEEAICEGYEGGPESVLAVDVGGGLGHDLSLFRAKLPNSRGRLILQDLPQVLDTLPTDLHERIEPMRHDFFLEQPVKAARVYILKSVLHDWPFPTALRILQNITPAMKRGYSKLLIIENVLPETGAPFATVGLDLILMVAAAALERTEAQWRELLDAAGLSVESIWRRPDGDAVVEAVLK